MKTKDFYQLILCLLLATCHVCLAETLSAGVRHSILAGDSIARVSVEDTVRKKNIDTISSNDSVENILPGLEVVSKNYLHLIDRSIYTPTKAQRNVSYDALSLLQNMHIPQLINTGKGFKAAGGGEIKYFINGHPAGEDELSNMNMNDVRKVEYLDFPSDANFMGVEHAVNFVLAEYEYGGYSRVKIDHDYLYRHCDLWQSFFSKFSYRRMTFDLSALAYTRKVHNNFYDVEATFRLKDGEVTRYQNPSKSREHNVNFPIQFRAVYSKGSTYISNKLGFAFFESLDASSNGTVRFQEADIEGYTYRATVPQRVPTYFWDGYGYFDLGRKWTLAAEGSLRYSHYNMVNKYVTNSVLDIDNHVKENSVEGRFVATLSKRFSASHGMDFVLQYNNKDSRAEYAGSTDDKSHFHQNTFAGRAGYNYTGNKLRINTYAGIASEMSDMTGMKVTTTYPYGIVSMNYFADKKNSLNLWMQYSTFSPNANTKNPVRVQKNEFLYVEGNPDTHPYPRFETSLRHMLQLYDNFFISSVLGVNYCHDRLHTVYRLLPDGDAVVRSYENSGSTGSYYINTYFSLDLFNRKIHLGFNPEFRVQKTSVPGAPVLYPFTTFCEVVWFHGNFLLAGHLWTRNCRTYTGQTMDFIEKLPHNYDVNASWGNGTWNVTMSVRNFFNKSRKGKVTTIDSDCYSSVSTHHTAGYLPSLKLVVSYTFGYGRRINRQNELDMNTPASTSTVNL